MESDDDFVPETRPKNQVTGLVVPKGSRIRNARNTSDRKTSIPWAELVLENCPEEYKAAKSVCPIRGTKLLRMKIWLKKYGGTGSPDGIEFYDGGHMEVEIGKNYKLE